jgi:hypothetical protein
MPVPGSVSFSSLASVRSAGPAATGGLAEAATSRSGVTISEQVQHLQGVGGRQGGGSAFLRPRISPG